MKRHLFFWGVFLVCGLLFWGCSEKAGPEKESSAGTETDLSTGNPGKGQGETSLPSVRSAGEGETASNKSAGKGKAISTPMPKEADYRVCLIGNSLIQYGNQARFLEDIALGYGVRITVDQITWGGAYLSDYVEGIYLEKSAVKRRLRRADIVVFQDYGGWQGKQTVKSIKNLKRWCKKKAECFYYMYEDDDVEMESSDYRKLERLNLKLIPKGQLIDAVSDRSYPYEDLHLANDFHPNCFNGYLAALAMHAVIFGKKCRDYPEEWFFQEREGSLGDSMKEVRETLRGDSEKEKWEEFQAICRQADLLVQRTAAIHGGRE